jgi:phosphatidylserine decarboxylase
VGALLLVAIQYRKKVKQAKQEVDVNEDGLDIIKLKGPWHVCTRPVLKIFLLIVWIN